MLYLKAFFVGLIFSSLLYAQHGTLKGRVTDADTGEPLIGANVIIQKTNLGAATDVGGYYEITNITPGLYSVKFSYVGYESFIKDSVEIKQPGVTELDAALITDFSLPEIVVTDSKIIFEKYTNTVRVISSESIESIQVQVGGYTAEFSGGCYLANYNTEEYAKIDENGFVESIKKPLSTFSIDVDAASYTNTRRFLTQGRLPPKDAVRVEEFINYFDYDYPDADDEHPFSIYTEYSKCPWNDENYLVHIGLQGKKLEAEERQPSNLVFLLDVSGSMTPDNKLPLLKRAFKLLTQQLADDDIITIVVYAGAAGLVLPPTKGSEKRTILDAISNLRAGGSTAGGEGIKLAYKMAEENFLTEGNNRVILATDGDFNIGISSTSELVRFLEEKRDEGIFLTVLGFGQQNIKDNRLEQLADNGNGHYAYIDNFLEAKKVFVDELGSTLYTIAKDVKIQVEFNPAKVKSYRLVGYENRLLNDEDFEDDKKDAGEIGAGHTVTALYEIIPADDYSEYDLKYLKTKVKEEALNSNELMTVSIRYKKPDEDESNLISRVVFDEPLDEQDVSDNFNFSASVVQFAMLLRDSEFKANATYYKVTELVKRSMGEDNFGYRAEFLRLVKLAEEIPMPVGALSE